MKEGKVKTKGIGCLIEWIELLLNLYFLYLKMNVY